jgi:hypothetical protein
MDEDRSRTQDLGVGTKIELTFSFVRNVAFLVESDKLRHDARSLHHRVGS